MERTFEKLAHRVAGWAGQPPAFAIAALVVVVWALTGPLFGYSDTWQLVINTGTTVVTFLMVFLIQNAQNRDASAMQAKLDELIRAAAARATTSSASNTAPSANWARSSPRSSASAGTRAATMQRCVA